MNKEMYYIEAGSLVDDPILKNLEKNRRFMSHLNSENFLPSQNHGGAEILVFGPKRLGFMEQIRHQIDLQRPFQ